jgi:copper chaperone CopZ
MADVEGVSDVSCDRGSRTVNFNAAGDEAIKAGLAALAKAGFHGDAVLGNRKLEYPAEKVEKNATSDEVTFYGVHLCCGGCAKAVSEALKEIGEASCDREARVVVVKGDGISVAKAMEALNKAGFHGSLKKPEAEEGK